MDKFYRYTPKNKLKSAGYIQEKFNSKDYFKFNDLLTPTFKIKKPTTKKNLILVSTGSFAPIHLGHIEMMEQAKIRAEALGYEVIGGYLSPSHDTYVKEKLKDEFISLPERFNSIEAIIESNSWLMLDKFEGLLPYPVNFTTVIIKLEKFLKEKFPENLIQIGYVYGSDNEDFGWAFIKNGLGFCIERDLYSFRYNFKNVINCPKTKMSALSSTQIRKPQYLIRKEPVSPIKEISYQDYELFCIGLKDIFSKLHLSPELIEAKTNVKSNYPIISLDSYFKGDYNLHISREFNLDHQLRPNYLIARPDYPELENQIKSIPKGEYCLVDDDKATGTTIGLVKQLLSHCIIKEEQFLIDTSNSLDIVDCRDFLWGAKDGGLVIKNSSHNFRVPYLFPWVNLVSRAKIESHLVLWLTEEIWKLNELIFSKYPEIKIKDLEPVNQSFFSIQKYNQNMKLLTFIKNRGLV